MKYPVYLLLSEDAVADDEIEELFNQLEVIEPPPFLVERILTSVALLSQQASMSASPWGNVDGLVICYDVREPS
jgi:hypothetical protein